MTTREAMLDDLAAQTNLFDLASAATRYCGGQRDGDGPVKLRFVSDPDFETIWSWDDPCKAVRALELISYGADRAGLGGVVCGHEGEIEVVGPMGERAEVERIFVDYVDLLGNSWPSGADDPNA